MRFEFAWLLLALPILLVLIVWLSRRSYAQLEPWARRASAALRLIIVALLLAALTRPDIMRRADESLLVILIDVSPSVADDNVDAAIHAAEQLARQQIARGSGHSVALIAFGERSQVLVDAAEQFDALDEALRERITFRRSLPELYAERTRRVSAGADDAAIEKLNARIDAVETFRDDVAGDHTDLEQTMRLARSIGDQHAARLIYTLSDGHFNRGDTEGAIAQLDDSVEFQMVRLGRDGAPEVAATSIDAPQNVRVNQTFTAALKLLSSVETDAQLAVHRDGVIVHEQQVRLQPGENDVSIPGLYFRDKGFHAVEAVVRADHDTQLRNNTIRELLIVPGEARVLYVEADETQSLYLKGALELEGMQVDVRPAAGVPDRLSDLLSYDAFVLCNVPADRLSLRQMQMIQMYVRDFGGGFVMLGGDESFGLGGYFNTPIEDTLPVRMPIQKDLLRPSLALMLVIDKSGSMAGVKIQLAKRAAIATAEAINPADQIGVVGFDGASQVILELTVAGDRQAIEANIASLDGGGGTFLYPALEDARERLQGSNARKKHVIVLSDGQTQGFGYEEIAQLMALEGITLSTVGIGEGADMQLLERMAAAGGGRAYFTNDFYSIPQIFTREALRASKNMLVERLIIPVAINDDPALREIDVEDLPLLSGYVATTPKPESDVLIVSDSGDPILARWRYGLGSAAAYTSDTKPRWAEDWIQWPDFAKFWAQLLRSVAGRELGEDLFIETTHRMTDEGVVLTADIRDAAGGFVDDVDMELTAFASNDRRKLDVERIGPGLFEARLDEFSYGDDQQLAWQATRDQDEPRTIAYGFVESFSPEFRTLGPNDELFETLAERDDVKVASLDSVTFEPSARRSARWVPLWPALLTIAVLLVPVDILIRRIG